MARRQPRYQKGPEVSHFTEREAFAIFEGCLLNQPEAVAAIGRMDSAALTEYIDWAAKFYDACSDGIDLIPKAERPDEVDLQTDEGKAFLGKVVRAVKKNRFGEDMFW